MNENKGIDIILKEIQDEMEKQFKEMYQIIQPVKRSIALVKRIIKQIEEAEAMQKAMQEQSEKMEEASAKVFSVLTGKF